MNVVNKTILQKLKKPDPKSHKGENGRILIIAGSEKYHGALLLAVQVASRIVDMVYVHSTDENLKLIKNLKSEISVFIGVKKQDLWETVELVDAILIGPGLEETDEVLKIKAKLLKEFEHKKIVIDATAMWHLNTKLVHKNCILTPHSREFGNAFEISANSENCLKIAGKLGCIIVLKGKYDYISDGKDLWENRTGNVGMTKGGTGDVLSGLITALAATNDGLTSALAGTYLNGLAGDRLFEKVGTFYNAEDLVKELGALWATLINANLR